MSTLLDTIKSAGGSMSDWTVMSNLTDPYRLDTPANHRDAKWLADAFAQGKLVQIHCRGLHYTIVSLPELRKPNGEPYLNSFEDWTWLQRVVGYARWLGYIDFEAISDERNAGPELWLPPSIDEAGLRIAHDADDLAWPIELPSIQIKCQAPHARQAYRLVLIGEKSSLRTVLKPLCAKYEAELILPTGELSTTLLHGMVQRAAADGRPTRVFYLSDFDPSGIHMPVEVARKIQALCDLKFQGLDIELHRCALLADQVKALGLPETPMKDSERRADKWRERFNCEQTEIDALATLQAGVLTQIVENDLKPYFDPTLQKRQRQAYEVAAQAMRNTITAATAPYQNQIDEAQDLIDAAAQKLAAAHEFCRPLFDDIADGIDFVDVEEVTPKLDPGAFAIPMFSSLDDFATTTKNLLGEKL
jgi:hypothetical protein